MADELTHVVQVTGIITKDYVSLVSPIVEITESGDLETMKEKIKARYGFECTSRYCRDLLDFVEALTSEQQ